MENNTQKKKAPNELQQKQVFIDLDTKFQTEMKADEKKTIFPDLHKKTVFDEAYAIMKKARTNPVSPRLSAPAPKRSSRENNRFRPKKLWSTRLCSGELPQDALRRITNELLVLVLFCCAVAFLVSVKGLVLDRITDTDYSSLARGTSYSAPVGDTEFSFSSDNLPDGFAAAQAVCTHLDRPITDASVLKHNRRAPVYPGKVLSAMNSALPENSAALKTNLSNLDLLVQIYQSLEHDTPVIVLLSEKDEDTYRIQYAIVTHMDAEENLITVCNPNSGVKDYTLEQFIAATRFDNFEDKPLRVRTALAVGSWNRNTAIFVSNANEE